MPIEHETNSPLAEAVRAANGQSPFARLIGRGQSTVHGWLKEGKPLPAEHVLVVEKATGVQRFRLRPDIYPPDHLTDMSIAVGAVTCERDTLSHSGDA